jgi:protein SCO1/2
MLKRPLLWIAFAVCALAVPVGATLIKRARAQVKLPSYGSVPDFALVDQDGHPFTTADLRGKVVVADFVFTSCSSACPRLTQEMAGLQRHLINRGADGRVRLVSISVDPERDTPERLKAYAAGFSADPRLWSFLTGPADRIRDAVVGGFKQGLEKEKDPSEKDGFTILHGTKMVLLDGKGTMRGFFDANEPESMTQLRLAVAALLERGGE